MNEVRNREYRQRNNPDGIVAGPQEEIILKPFGAWPFHVHGTDCVGWYASGRDGLGTCGTRYYEGSIPCECKDTPDPANLRHHHGI